VKIGVFGAKTGRKGKWPVMKWAKMAGFHPILSAVLPHSDAFLMAQSGLTEPLILSNFN